MNFFIVAFKFVGIFLALEFGAAWPIQAYGERKGYDRAALWISLIAIFAGWVAYIILEAQSNSPADFMEWFALVGLSVLAANVVVWPIVLLLPRKVKPVTYTHKRCPYCAEPIRIEAVRCRFCGSDLVSADDTPADQPQEPEDQPNQPAPIRISLPPKPERNRKEQTVQPDEFAVVAIHCRKCGYLIDALYRENGRRKLCPLCEAYIDIKLPPDDELVACRCEQGHEIFARRKDAHEKVWCPGCQQTIRLIAPYEAR